MSRSSIQDLAPIEQPGRTVTDAPAVMSVRGLSVEFATKRGAESVLNNVSLDIPRGQNLGLVGESGCGKSTLLKAALRALAPNARTLAGQVMYEGIDLLAADPETVRKLRWSKISMIPQSALNSLDPVHKVGDQIVEPVRAHTSLSEAVARQRARDMIARVGIDPKRMDDFPHQFSGGMRQRAIIAMALILQPDLVLADEPTTSLDVIVQDQIFRLIRQLQEEFGFSMLLVTHDLGLVIENCNRIAVMYAGAVVEEGLTREVVSGPFHPYTLGLKNSMPSIGSRNEPISIPGSPPDPAVAHQGCRFVYRCPFSIDRCRMEVPELKAVDGGHKAACHRSLDMPSLRGAAERYETWAGKET